MQLPESSGRVLRALMEERGLSAAGLSRLSGVDSGTVRRILHGQCNAVSTRGLLALARCFDRCLADFIDELAEHAPVTDKIQQPFTQCSRENYTRNIAK